MTELAVDFGSEPPASWAVAAIQEVAEMSPKLEVSDLENDRPVHFVPMSAVAEDFGGLDASQLRSLHEVRKGYTYFSEGDVLFAKITPCMENGKGAIVPNLQYGHAFGSTEFHVLRPGDAVANKWLAYYLSQPDFRRVARQNMTGTAGQLRVPSKWLGAAGVPIPPRAEQTRIVEKLDELLSDLDAGVAELKAAQRKLAQYRQSLLKAAVEGALTADWRAAHGTPQETGAELLQRILTARRARWEQKQLARFAEQGKTPPKGWQAKYPEPVAPDFAGLPQLPAGWVWASVEQIASDEPYALAIGPFGSNLVVPDYRDKGVPLVFVRNIRSKIYGGSATKFVTPEKANELKAHQVTAGDVLVTKMGEPPGDADVYPVGQPMAVITADCIKIRPAHELIDPHYLAAVINSPWGIEQIKPMTQGVAQKKVSLGRFSGFVLPLPSKAEQDVVVALLAKSFTSIEEQDVSTELSLKQAAAQRKNLLKAAFAGQLVPQDPDDEPASALLARIRAAREQAPPTRGRKRTGSTPAPATKSPVPGKRGRKPGALP